MFLSLSMWYPGLGVVLIVSIPDLSRLSYFHMHNFILFIYVQYELHLFPYIAYKIMADDEKNLEIFKNQLILYILCHPHDTLMHHHTIVINKFHEIPSIAC